MLWIGTVVALSYSGITTEFAKEAALDRAFMARIEADAVLVPVSCPGDGTMQVRGVEGTDYTRDSEGESSWRRDACWYELPTFRSLYPEYAGEADTPLIERLYAEAGRSTIAAADPWGEIAQAALLALLPPVGLLALGAAFGWILAGFYRRPV